MSALPDPVWPVIVLAAITAVDGVLCLRPVPFVARCLHNVGWPKRLWPLLAPLKFAAALGLIAGIWIPWLGLVTTVCLVAYFVVAITMHIRARDFGRDLFVNATGMLLLCLGTLLWSFVL